MYNQNVILHHLLTLMPFQTCTIFFLLWITKGDILKKNTAVQTSRYFSIYQKKVKQVRNKIRIRAWRQNVLFFLGELWTNAETVGIRNKLLSFSRHIHSLTKQTYRTSSNSKFACLRTSRARSHCSLSFSPPSQASLKAWLGPATCVLNNPSSRQMF